MQVRDVQKAVLKRAILGALLAIIFIAAILSFVRERGLTGFASVVYTQIEVEEQKPGSAPPKLTTTFPQESRVTIKEPESQSFFAEATDPDSEVRFQWQINDIKLEGENDKKYTFEGGYTKAGTYRIGIIAFDESSRDARSWILTVNNTPQEGVYDGCNGLCCDVQCRDTRLTCADGTESVCGNRCNPLNGQCGSCVPKCFEYFSAPSKDVKRVGQPPSRKTIPCVNVTESVREEIKIKEEDLPSQFKIPPGYSVVMQPFSIDCSGGNVEMTLSISQKFYDVAALQCSGADCKSFHIKNTTRLKCGNQVFGEILRKEEVVEPKFFQVPIEQTTLNLTEFRRAVFSGETSVLFYGEFFENLSVTLFAPNGSVPEASNLGLKITGTPLVLSFNHAQKGLGSTVSMPFKKDDEIIEETVAIYGKTAEGWEQIDSAIDPEKRIVTGNISDIGRFIDSKRQAMFALMGVYCRECFNSSLKMIYNPVEPSRNALILVHGLASSPATFQEMIDDVRLTQGNFQIWVFSYSPEKTIGEASKDLAKLIEAEVARFDNLYIVAHSLGGLVAQQALNFGFTENKKFERSYTFVGKVRKVVLAGAPNEGSPAAEVYLNLFKSLINKKGSFNVFNYYSNTIREVVNGIITPRVPGISYYVVAGTKPYEFNQVFFGKSGFREEVANDGVVSVRSAQHVGEGYIDNQCGNYFEVNVSHSELIDNPYSRQIIEKIVSSEILGKEEEASLLGQNNYFDMKVVACSPLDKFVVVGREAPYEKIQDPSGCSCGNGYCGFGEDESNCPSDCGNVFARENLARNSKYIAFLVIAGYLIFISKRRKYFRKYAHLSYIIRHIRNDYDVLYDGGISRQDLQDLLVVEGWSRKHVSESLERLSREQEMKFERIRRFVKEGLGKGFLHEYILDKAKEKGYDESLVVKALKNDHVAIGFRKKQRETQNEGRFFRIRR